MLIVTILDPIKEYAEYIVMVLGIFGFFIVRYYFDKRARFNYYLTNSIDLIRFQNTKYNISLHYNDMQISKPKIVRFKFSNIGDLTIDESDWELPLQIVFNEGKILNAFISNKRNESIKCDIELEEKSLILKFGFLNKNDFVTLDILVDSEQINYNIQCRIKHIENIESKEFDLHPISLFKTILQFILVFFVFIGGLTIIALGFKLIGNYIPTWLSKLLGIVILVFSLIYLMKILIEVSKKRI